MDDSSSRRELSSGRHLHHPSTRWDSLRHWVSRLAHGPHHWLTHWLTHRLAHWLAHRSHHWLHWTDVLGHDSNLGLHHWPPTNSEVHWANLHPKSPLSHSAGRRCHSWSLHHYSPRLSHHHSASNWNHSLPSHHNRSRLHHDLASWSDHLHHMWLALHRHLSVSYLNSVLKSLVHMTVACDSLESSLLLDILNFFFNIFFLTLINRRFCSLFQKLSEGFFHSHWVLSIIICEETEMLLLIEVVFIILFVHLR